MAAPPFRLVICFLLFLNIVLCYLDRLNMSVCALPMAKEFGWSESTKVRPHGALFAGVSGVLWRRFCASAGALPRPRGLRCIPMPFALSRGTERTRCV